MKTDYYTSPTDNFITQSYFPAQDKVTFISFWSESNARSSNTELVVGMWKPKFEYEDREYLDYLNEMSSDYNRGIGYL